ncbi:MAG: hypothetical protein V7849_00020 [Candidatus Competibacter sp.]
MPQTATDATDNPTILGQAPQSGPVRTQGPDQAAQGILDFPVHLIGRQVDETCRQFDQQGFKPQPVFEFGPDVGVASIHGIRMLWQFPLSGSGHKRPRQGY